MPESTPREDPAGSDAAGADKAAGAQEAPASTDLRAFAPFFGLFALLCLATFFEGFDTKLASLVQPVIGKEFGASNEELGVALGVSSFGMVLGFFVILLADTFGRRPIFLLALAGYALLTLATAFAESLFAFTALQFFARMAMVVELFLAYLILSEEMPPAIRGRVNGFFASTANFGAAFPAALLAPLEAMGPGWRGLFWIGALPLLLFPLFVLRIRETRVFKAKASTNRRYGEDFKRVASALWSSTYRGRLIRISALWFIINFWTGTALYFFTLYTYGERGWSAADLQKLPWGVIPFGLAGYIFSGFLMDAVGRRRAAAAYLVAAFLATAYCYQSRDPFGIYLGYFCLVGLGGVWTVVTTWTTELFPTESRATALGLSNMLIGRMGLVLGPMVAGALSTAWGSTSHAVTALGLSTLLGLPLVGSLPETNAISLNTLSNDRPTEGDEPLLDPRGE